MTNTTRRAVLAAGATGALGVMAACGNTGSAGAGGGAGGGGTTGGGQAGGSGSTAMAGSSLGSTTDVPIGGGTVYSAAGVVVTQPTAGVFKAFSTTCTHQGCAVNSVRSGLIVCPCHGGSYSITDGTVRSGPPPAALHEVAITVEGTNLVLG